MEEDEGEGGPLRGADRVAEVRDREEHREDLAERRDRGDDDGAALAEEAVDAKRSERLGHVEKGEVARDARVRGDERGRGAELAARRGARARAQERLPGVHVEHEHPFAVAPRDELRLVPAVDACAGAVGSRDGSGAPRDRRTVRDERARHQRDARGRRAPRAAGGLVEKKERARADAHGRDANVLRRRVPARRPPRARTDTRRGRPQGGAGSRRRAVRSRSPTTTGMALHDLSVTCTG